MKRNILGGFMAGAGAQIIIVGSLAGISVGFMVICLAISIAGIAIAHGLVRGIMTTVLALQMILSDMVWWSYGGRFLFFAPGIIFLIIGITMIHTHLKKEGYE